MKRSQISLMLVLGGAAMVCVSACEDDDGLVTASGGSSGHSANGGSAGHSGTSAIAGSGGVSAGSAGVGEGGGAGEGGTSGTAGAGGTPSAAGEGGLAGTAGQAGSPTAGEGGAAAGGEAGSGAGPQQHCGPATLTEPTVDAQIAVDDSATLVAAYAAVGVQTYTCTLGGTLETPLFAWSAGVPTANLYGPSCGVVATHYVGPHWKAADGSIILGAKERGVPSATAGAIDQLLLSAGPDVLTPGSTGIFTGVTAVQRLDTVGGNTPSTPCDLAHVGTDIAVPYTATYYFYTGADSIPTVF